MRTVKDITPRQSKKDPFGSKPSASKAGHGKGKVGIEMFIEPLLLFHSNLEGEDPYDEVTGGYRH